MLTTDVDGGGLLAAADGLRSCVEDVWAALQPLETTLGAVVSHHWVAVGSDEFGDIYAGWAAALRAGLEGLLLLADGVSTAGSTYDEAEAAAARSFFVVRDAI